MPNRNIYKVIRKCIHKIYAHINIEASPVNMFADVHCHLFEKDFPNYHEVLNSAQEQQVKRVIVNGCDHNDNQIINGYEHPILRKAFGAHPCFYHEDIKATIDWIKKNADQCIAIGEIGLDLHWKPETFDAQKEHFLAMLQLAQELDKPVIIHSRKAEDEVLDILEKSFKGNVVLHAFGGNKTKIQRAVQAKHYLSIPTNVVRSEQTQRLVKFVPLRQLLTETDAPYMSAFPDKSSEPKYVPLSVQKIAEIKGITVEECTNQLFMNYQYCFAD